MKSAPFALMLPAVNDDRFSTPTTPISQTTGLGVEARFCPTCRFVELYAD